MLTVIRVLGSARSWMNLGAADPSQWHESVGRATGEPSTGAEGSPSSLHPWSLTGGKGVHPGFMWTLSLPPSQGLGGLSVELAALSVHPAGDPNRVHRFLVGADLGGLQTSVETAGTADEPGLRCLRFGVDASTHPGRREARITMAVRRMIAKDSPVDLLATCKLDPQDVPSALVLIDRLLWGAALLARIKDTDARPASDLSTQTGT